jgi:hypothetical protein
MKLTGPVTVFAVLFSLPVPGLAQDAKPAPAKPAAAPAQPAAEKPAAKPEAPAAQTAPAVKVASGTPRRSRSNEDARTCLELATNMEIHKCAEPYR